MATISQAFTNAYWLSQSNGLSLAHVTVLVFMYDNNVELTPTQVSKVLNVTRGHSTRLIYKLQSKGLVELAIGDFDKRNRLLSLSEAGRKFVISIAKDHGESLFRNFQRDDSPDTGQEDVALHPDGAVSSTPTEDVVGRSDRPENGEDAGELHEAETDPSKLFPTELDFIRPKGESDSGGDDASHVSMA